MTIYIKFTILIILSAQFSGIKHTHIAIQPPPSHTETLPPLNTPPPAPQPLADTITLLSVWESVSGASHKWDHAVVVLLCLARDTWHHAFKVRPWYSVHQNLIPFDG